MNGKTQYLDIGQTFPGWNHSKIKAHVADEPVTQDVPGWCSD